MYNDSRISVTHAEYNEAFKRKLKIFSLVDKKVWAFHNYYTTLIKTEPRPDLTTLPPFPGISNFKVFDFIDSVRQKDRNNGIGFFDSFSDIEEYLAKQWAGLFFKLLTSDIEDNAKKGKASYALTGNIVTSNLNTEFNKHRYNQ